jgi:hypothetical protein
MRRRDSGASPVVDPRAQLDDRNHQAAEIALLKRLKGEHRQDREPGSSQKRASAPLEPIRVWMAPRYVTRRPIGYAQKFG